MTALDVTTTQTPSEDHFIKVMPPNRVMIQTNLTVTHYGNVPTRFIDLLTYIVEFFALPLSGQEPIGNIYPRRDGWSYRDWL